MIIIFGKKHRLAIYYFLKQFILEWISQKIESIIEEVIKTCTQKGCLYDHPFELQPNTQANIIIMTKGSFEDTRVTDSSSRFIIW